MGDEYNPLEGLGAFLEGLDSGSSPLETCRNSYEFVKRYNLTIDHNPIDLDDTYKHLRDMYEDDHPAQVIMAAAQTGKTARLFTFLARMAVGLCWGRLLGYYLPTQDMMTKFARDRFRPYIRSNPDLAALLGAPRADSGDTKGVDNILTLSLGETTLFCMTIGSKTATEGLPLRGLAFDEVRQMKAGDIQRAMERTSAQNWHFDIKVSTARFPKTDIHKYFLEGDQRYFHTSCKCSDGAVMTLNLLNGIEDLRHASQERVRHVQHVYSHAGLPSPFDVEGLAATVPAVFVCPKCSEVIIDPRDGWWEPHGSDTGVHSYQMAQLHSPAWTAGKILFKYEHADDMQEVYNSMFGMPWVDHDKMPCRMEHVRACENPDLRWGVDLTETERKRRITNTCMGVDVQAGYLIAVVKGMAPNGKHRAIHVEVVERTQTEDEWHVLAKMMETWDVRAALVDAAPEFGSAENFARAFPGRVWLQDYTVAYNGPRSVEWMDDTLLEDNRQRGAEIVTRYRVRMQRTRVLRWACQRWINRVNEIPPIAAGPRRDLPSKDNEIVFSAHLRVGLRRPANVATIWAKHQTLWTFQEKKGEDKEALLQASKKGNIEIEAEWTEQDPHFSHADTWASVALARFGAGGKVR